MVYKQIIILQFFIFFISISVAAQVPKWAETNSHKNYPSSKYLLGVGIAADKTRAMELARADVAKQIQVKIESELETMERETGADDKHSLKTEITSRTKSAVSETIAGIEIKETKRAKDNYYALAVLNKQNYIAGLEQEMADISFASKQYLQGARDLVLRGNIFTAFDNYLSAQNDVTELFVRRSLHLALSGKHFSVQDISSPDDILAEIRTLLSGIHIKIISGDNQQGQIGSLLGEPIVAKVYLYENGQEIGLGQIPVSVKYSGGEVVGKPLTDDRGIVSVNLVASPEGSVIFTPDFKKIPGQFQKDLQKIQAVSKYTGRSSNIVLDVNILNISGQPDRGLNSRIKSLINENGYKTDSSALFLIRGQPAITKEKTINSPAGKQFYIEMELPLILIEKAAGIQLASVIGFGKGLAMGSRDMAVSKAMENISLSKSKFAGFLHAANKP